MRDVLHTQDVDELVQMRLETSRRAIVGMHENRHAGDSRLVSASYRQRLDIESSSTKKRDDSVEHAGAVFNMSDKRSQYWLVHGD